MAGNPIPFQNLVNGQRYFITMFENDGSISLFSDDTRLEDLPGTLLEKNVLSPAQQEIHFMFDAYSPNIFAYRFPNTKFKLDIGQGPPPAPSPDVTEAVQRYNPQVVAEPVAAQPLVYGPGTILLPIDGPLPGIPAPEGSPAGSPPIQVKEIDFNDICSICLEQKTTKYRYVGKCGHSIHLSCYNSLSIKKCPICRQTPYGGRKSRRLRRKHKSRKHKKTRRNY